MYIRSVKFKNVFAFGNHEVFIDLTKDAEAFWQVLGKNGVGKTSFVKIVKIGLYPDELDGLKIDEVAHQINKNGLIEINVDSNGANWLIQSTYSPDNIRVYKNGSEKPEEWGGKGDVKKKIKQEISTIPYHIFNNTISLAVNDFKSFLTMTPKDAREIRDRIFGFFIFNQMAEDFKKENSTYNKEYETYNSEINILNSQISNHQEVRGGLIENINNSNKDTVDSYNAQIETLDATLKSKQEELLKKQNALKTLKMFLYVNSNKIFEQTIGAFEFDLAEIKKKYEHSDKSSQSINAEIQTLVNERNLVFNKQLKTEIVNYKENLGKIQTEKERLGVELSSLDSELSNIKKNSEINGNKLVVNTYLDGIGMCVTTLDNLVKHRKNLLESYATNNDAFNRLDESSKFMNNESIKLISEKNVLAAKIKLFDSGKCGSCGSDLTTNDKVFEKQQAENRISEIDSKLNEYSTMESQNDVDKTNIDKQIADVRKQIITNTEQINSEIGILVGMKKAIFDITSKFGDIPPVYDSAFGFIDGLKSKFDDGTLESSDIVVGNPLNAMKYVTLDENFDEQLTTLGSKLSKLENEKSVLDNKIISTKSSITITESKLRPETDIESNLQFSSEQEYDFNINQKNTLLSSIMQECNTGKASIEKIQMDITKCRQSIVQVPDNILAAYNNSQELQAMDFPQRESSIKSKIDAATDSSSNIEQLISDTKLEIEGLNIKKAALADEKNHENQLKSIDQIISSTMESVSAKTAELDKTNKKILANDMILYSLGDEGIKAYILKNIIPSINYEVQQYLQNLGIPLEVSFNETFEVTVKRFGIQANLKSISLGQTKMIDCCILLAITKILKMKYTDINLVFYDEVFSSLDSDNRPIIIEMFYKVCCEMLKMNVFMMGHFYIPIAHESKVIEIKSDTRFSELNQYSSDDYMRINAG